MTTFPNQITNHNRTLRTLAAPSDILEVWHRFDAIPMETLSKVWVALHQGDAQRTIAQMEQHRAQFGSGGNCFDLAIWLKHHLAQASITSTFISNDIHHADAHVALIATDSQGARYLCDLGDMWLQPIAIDTDITAPVYGFFPAAGITLQHQEGNTLRVRYHRPGGKISSQTYSLNPIDDSTWAMAAHQNQRNLAQVLVEMRDHTRRVHWEFHDYTSHWSTDDGVLDEPQFKTTRQWSQRIEARTGMNALFVETCLNGFEALT